MMDFILTFSLYAFAGWVMETIYRTIHQRRVVNPGFLAGPFLPIYGFFTTLVIWSSVMLSQLTWAWQFVCFVLLSTLLEYVAGLFFERFFHLQLWDYHSIPFNFQGRIALPYSLLWGILGLVFHLVIHPAVQIQMLLIPQTVRSFLAIILTVYMLWAIIRSILLLRRLEHFVTMFQERYERLELSLFYSAWSPYQRFLYSYPKMRHTLSEKMALLYAKQEALEHFLNQQRQKFSNSSKDNDPHSFD